MGFAHTPFAHTPIGKEASNQWQWVLWWDRYHTARWKPLVEW